ncbi:MAG: TIGR03668 family PPOX class F420-dependent oxidoreductase [Chloroflexota bacterium]
MDTVNRALDGAAWQYLDAHRVGHLATVDDAGRPSIVPLCYATDHTAIYSALDDKPKRVRPEELARVRNLRAHPDISLVVDDYSEDWRQLTYLLIHGRADILAPEEEDHLNAVVLLRAKYAQYERMPIQDRPIICIHPGRSLFWAAQQESSNNDR